MLGRFDYSTISQVQQANDIVDVISEHLSLTKKGREMVGLCPFHEDHRPSLNVNPVKQIFKCFACSVGGDVLKFIQLVEGLSFPQAVERLAERAGIRIKPKPVSQDSKDARPHEQDQPDPKQLARLNAWALKLWQANLAADNNKAQGVRNYVAARKITPESTKKWALGFASDEWDALLKAAKPAKIPIKLLQQTGMIVARESDGFYDKFRNRLMFPITDVTGRVIGFGGRALGDDAAKYMNSPATALFDKGRTVYGLEQARHSIVSCGTVVVVEGYTDCIMAHQFGCENVVATLGTSFTEAQARLLRRYAKQIVLVFDNDAAGLAAANRALEVCLGQRIDIKIASVPEGKDPCDFLLSAGREAFDALLAKAVDVMQFKWDLLLAKFHGGETFAEKRAATEEYLRSVGTAIAAGNLDAIGRGLIVNRLCKIIGLSAEQINAELAKTVRRIDRGLNHRRADNVSSGPNLGTGFFARAQQELLEVLLNKPEMFARAKETIAAEEFDVPILRQIADALFETLNCGDKWSLERVLARVESVDAGAAIVQLAEQGRKKENFDVRLSKALEAVGEYRRERLRSKTATIKDETESLRRFQNELSSRNSRNPGMLSM